MPTLYLLRHASSPLGEDDYSRSLDAGGLADAQELGAYLQRNGVQLDVALCSSAQRTLETWESMTAAWDPKVTVTPLDPLYLASASELLSGLRKLPEDRMSALLLAHNPGVQDLAVGLAGEGDHDAYVGMRDSYPAAALCELSFDGPWSSLTAGAARLVRFAPPGALP
jgi:phosphohistidine phosphatase